MYASTSDKKKRGGGAEVTVRAKSPPIAESIPMNTVQITARLSPAIQATAAARIPPKSLAVTRMKNSYTHQGTHSAAEATATQYNSTTVSSVHDNSNNDASVSLANLSDISFKGTKYIPSPKALKSSHPSAHAARSPSPEKETSSTELVEKKMEASLATVVDTNGAASQAVVKAVNAALQSAAQLASITTDDEASASDLLSNVVSIKRTLMTKLEEASTEATKAALETMALKGKLNRQDKELVTLRQEHGEATDVSFAADARISELFKQLKTVRGALEEQQEVFDRRVLELQQQMISSTSTAKNIVVTQKQIETYRNADIARLEEEVKGLRAHVQRQERQIVEKQIVQERAHRVMEENARQSVVIKDLEGKNEQLLTDVRSLLAKVQTQKDTFEAERKSLQAKLQSEDIDPMSASQENKKPTLTTVEDGSNQLVPMSPNALVVVPQVSPSRRGGAATLKFKKERLESMRQTTERGLLIRFYSNWRVQHALKIVDLVSSRNRALQQEAMIVRESQTKKLVMEKKDIADLNAELYERIDEQHSEIESLKQRLATANGKLEEAQQKLSLISEDDPSARLLSSEDLQIKALQAYNLLHPVLQGVKRRLKLDSLLIEPLRVAKGSKNTTDHVAVLVIQWIVESFSFVHQILSIDDRLSKVTVRIAFLNIKLRSKIQHITKRIRTETNLQKKTVLRKQLEGYDEILGAAQGLNSHIRSTRESLFATVNPAKQKELAVITHTFEADVDGFNRKLKRNESIQFQFALELSHMQNTHIDEIRNRIEGVAESSIRHRENTLLKRVDSASLKRRAKDQEQEKQHSSAEHPGSAGSGSSKVKLAPIPAQPKQWEKDPYEARNHHSMYINSVLQSGNDGKIAQHELSKLLSEAEKGKSMKAKIAVAPEMLAHRKQMKEAQRRREETLKLKAKERELHGGLQHFMANCGAVIPFRSNSVRTSSNMNLNSHSQVENEAVVTKLLGEVGVKKR